MKKLLALLAAFTMFFSIGTVASATVPEPLKDWSPVPITKDLTVQGVNPAETFTFTIGAGTVESGDATSAPAFSPGTFSIVLGEGVITNTHDLILPNFNDVGVYSYPITETVPNPATAGFDYTGGTLNLVVTVINNPDYDSAVEGSPKFLRVLTLTDENNVKEDAFENAFDSGNLTFNKVVTGNFGDPTDTFTVTVTLTPKAGKVLNASAIDHTGGTLSQPAAGGPVTITYSVNHGSSFTIKNIPYDVTYAVVETGFEGYTPVYTVTYDAKKEGEINASSISTTITNTRDQTIETGVNLDNLPYILLLAFAAGGLVIFAMRRRVTDR